MVKPHLQPKPTEELIKEPIEEPIKELTEEPTEELTEEPPEEFAGALDRLEALAAAQTAKRRKS